MTAQEALADGRLADANALQEAVVRDHPTDSAARLFYFELLALAGRLTTARDQLRQIESKDPDWPKTRRGFLWTLKAEYARSHRFRKPALLAKSPIHAKYRRRALQSLKAGENALASIWIDRADAAAPAINGHINGREFEGLRDTDDRYASVLEVFIRGEYVWFPFDQLRRITLAPAVGVLDTAFRPARLRLLTGAEASVIVPMLYPGSHLADDEYALGQEADWPEAPAGLVMGIGAKVWIVGEEELFFRDCRQLDFVSQ